MVLKPTAVPVAKSRDGIFAQVLTTILMDLYGRVPQDLFRTVERAGNFIANKKPAQVRADLASNDPYEFP
jgi:hypothetical protein